MPIFEIFVLAAVQGITEFLPVSSSGHLRITSDILGMSENTLVMDVAVHVGTLFAVMLYFWRDLVLMIAGLGASVRGRKHEGGRLAGFLVIATLPVVIAGFFGQSLIENTLRTVEIVGWTTIGFGVLLFLADRSGMRILRLEHMNLPNAVIIGLAQVLALIPRHQPFRHHDHGSTFSRLRPDRRRTVFDAALYPGYCRCRITDRIAAARK